MFWIDPTYFWYVFIPTLLISIGVQIYLKSTVSKWSQVRNGAGLYGIDVVKQLFQRTRLQPIQVERVPGEMTDHFDPHHNVVRLSDTTAGKNSVAAMAIAAHELGHVEQYQTGSALIGMRNFLLPALQFSPTISYIAIFLGLWFNMTNLLWIGILFFALMVLFSILTLPVEIDASRRALRLLNEAGLLVSDQDRRGAKAVLTAAGLTYLAAAVTSILQLLYYIHLAQRQQ
ncbi:MAG TPA: zinc metallopeptidase [Anaerolineae bacterium]|nr:zinc metallopeptidase [Anaerolineae bacterium]